MEVATRPRAWVLTADLLGHWQRSYCIGFLNPQMAPETVARHLRELCTLFDLDLPENLAAVARNAVCRPEISRELPAGRSDFSADQVALATRVRVGHKVTLVARIGTDVTALRLENGVEECRWSEQVVEREADGLALETRSVLALKTTLTIVP